MQQVCENHQTLGMISAALDASPQATIISDGEVLLFANAAARKLFKCTDPADLVGRPVTQIVHPNGHQTMAQRAEVLMQSSLSLRGLPVKLVALDGSCFSLKVTVTPVDHEGRRVFMFIEES